MMRKFNAMLASLQKRMRIGRKMSSEDVADQRIHTNMEVCLNIHCETYRDNRNSLDGHPRLSKIYITHSPPLFMGVKNCFGVRN